MSLLFTSALHSGVDMSMAFGSKLRNIWKSFFSSVNIHIDTFVSTSIKTSFSGYSKDPNKVLNMHAKFLLILLTSKLLKEACFLSHADGAAGETMTDLQRVKRLQQVPLITAAIPHTVVFVLCVVSVTGSRMWRRRTHQQSVTGRSPAPELPDQLPLVSGRSLCSAL